jgi:steroid delta-isomerase-like uncharacterized protein
MRQEAGMETPEPEPSDRKRILADFIRRAWSEGDARAVDDHIADRYTIHHDPGDPWEGRTLSREAFRERLVVSRAAAPDQVFDVVDLVADGDRVAVSWTWRGTHLGDLPGFPASGRPLAMSGLTIYFFEGDRLCGHWQVADRLGVYRQLVGG